MAPCHFSTVSQTVREFGKLLYSYKIISSPLFNEGSTPKMPNKELQISNQESGEGDRHRGLVASSCLHTQSYLILLSGFPWPPSGDLSDQAIKPASFMSTALAGGFLTTSATWEVQGLVAAKSLQSCPTLRSHRRQPPGSPVPGILQARTLEWVPISFSNAGKWKVKVKSLSRVRLLATPWTTAYQAPPSMGFSRQDYWSGVPLPSPNQV